MEFSVIVPVYNTEKYIDDCIASVLNQTYQSFEIILVDDGSTDNSGKLCDSYSAKDDRIRVYHNENHGQLYSREYGIHRARGNVCVFLDSDDSLKQNALQVISEAFKEYSCDCVAYGLDRVFNGQVIEEHRPETVSVRIMEEKKDIYMTFFFSEKYNSLCRKAVRRSVFHGYDYSRFYHIRYGEDKLHSIEIAKNADKIVVLPASLYNYSVNPNSMTHHKYIAGYKKDFTVATAVYDFLMSEGVLSDENLDQYKNHTLDVLVNEICGVARSDMGYREKKQVIHEITDSDFYKTITSNRRIRLPLKSRIIYFILKHRMVFLLTLLYRMKQ